MSELSGPQGTGSSAPAFNYLTAAEVRFLDAALARLIPADELGPGARETGGAYFIDQQLVSVWGSHGRNYRMGPWREGTSRQGFQSPLTPREIYRAAIREIDLYCEQQHGKRFCFLGETEQDAVLAGLDEGSIEIASVSGRLFVNLLWRNTVEGFFADPMYGGNQDKAGWRLIGFPGLASADYLDHMEQQHNVPYRVEPVGILDVVNGRVPVDAQGQPKRGPASGERS